MSEADHAPDPSAGTPRRSKRSATLSLVLVAGAGAGALALARLDPTQRQEEALVYATAGACMAESRRSAEACEAAERIARERYAATAPRYETERACERHHGRAGCRPGEDVTPDANGRYLPVMVAFLMGRSDEQDLPVQPLYAHAPEDEAQAAATGGGGHAGGYCTGAGGRVFTAGSGSRASVPTTVARAVPASPRFVSAQAPARGGFGGTGRAFSGGGHSGFGGG